MINNITIDCNNEIEFIELIRGLTENNSNYTNINLIHITKQQLDILCTSLINNNSLLSLNLSNNKLDCDQVKEILDSLKSNKTLRNLDLSHNKIQNKGAQAISDFLSINTSLVELNISINPLDDNGVKNIVNSLKINNSLISINLHSHQCTGDCDGYIKQHLFTNNKTILEFILNTRIGTDQNKPLYAWIRDNKTLLKKSLLSFIHSKNSLDTQYLNILYNSNFNILKMLFMQNEIPAFTSDLFALSMQYASKPFNSSQDTSFNKHISEYYNIEDRLNFITSYLLFMQIDMLALSHNIEGILTKHNLLFIHDGLNKGITPCDINLNLENILTNSESKLFIIDNLRTAGYLMCLEEKKLNSFIEMLSNTAINKIVRYDYTKIPAFINSYEFIKGKSEVCSSIRNMKSISSNTFENRYMSESSPLKNQSCLSIV